MQILLDTATDDKAELFRIGLYLVQTYATRVPAGPAADAMAARFKAPAAPPLPDAVPTPSAPVAETPIVVIPPPPNAPPSPALVEQDDDESPLADQGEPGCATIPSPPAMLITRTAAEIAAETLFPVIPPPPEVDSAGVAYDPNVHAANRAKTIAGTWKAKRKGGNVPLVPTVAPPAAAPAPAVPPPPPAPAAAVAPPVTSPPPPASKPAAVLPSPAPVGVTDFRNLMLRITAATRAGKITSEQVDTGLVRLGLQPKQLTGLASQPALVPAMAAYLDGLNAGV